jgi:tetratricopeptide (TPR) repeat protein
MTRGQQNAGQEKQPGLVAPGSSQQQAEAPRTPAELTLEDRGDIQMARKSYADALDFYQRALKHGESTPAKLWNKMGISYQQQQNYRASRKAYKKALRSQKDFAEVWNNIGTTYYLEKNAKKSIKYYRRAIELRSDNASFHLNLGTALYERKKYPEAVEEYRAAVVLDPECLTRHSLTGTVVQTREADAKFFFYLAKVFASVGRPEEAVRYLRRAFEDGFHDQKALEKDPDLQKLSDYPAYVELMKNPPPPIK